VPERKRLRVAAGRQGLTMCRQCQFLVDTGEQIALINRGLRPAAQFGHPGLGYVFVRLSGRRRVRRRI
jgi:hypothetical protein